MSAVQLSITTTTMPATMRPAPCGLSQRPGLLPTLPSSLATTVTRTYRQQRHALPLALDYLEPTCSTSTRCSSSSSSSSSCAGRHQVRSNRRVDSLLVCHAHPATREYVAPAEKPRKRLAVFVSGGGSNFRAIHAAILDGRINAEIVAVVSDVPTCGGVQYAQQHGIKTLTYPASKKGEFPGLTPEELVAELKHGLKADYVLLAGYLKLIPDALCAQYKAAMLNIHPGLLPSFGGKGMYGERVHKAVIASGARFSGPTVHFVDAEYDTGPILAQRVVPVHPHDTYKALAARVLKEEHSVYPEAVAALCDDRITWRADGIPIMWTAH